MIADGRAIFDGNPAFLIDEHAQRALRSQLEIDRAAFDMVKEALDGTFKGGRSLLLTAKEDAVGIPPENPNLSDDVQTKVNEIYQQIKSGAIVVADSQGSLFR